MKAKTQVQLLKDIINRSIAPGRSGLTTWAQESWSRADNQLLITPYDTPLIGHLVNRQLVERGIARMTGGQRMDRPAGVTQKMLDQLSRAVREMDAELMDPLTASAIIQVALYREVRHL